jgi:U3 small nucleolar RNA-associated protein 11
MQTQDLKYIKYKHQMERKKIDKIQSSSHLIDSEYRPAKSHIFFVDSQKQGFSLFVCFSSNKFLIINLVEKFDPVKQMRTHPSLINRQSNRLTIEQLKSTKLNFDEQEINLFQKMRKKKYLDLQKRIEREKKLQQVELAMEDKVLLKVKFN